jgi:hypothetical protein
VATARRFRDGHELPPRRSLRPLRVGLEDHQDPGMQQETSKTASELADRMPRKPSTRSPAKYAPGGVALRPHSFAYGRLRMSPPTARAKEEALRTLRKRIDIKPFAHHGGQRVVELARHRTYTTSARVDRPTPA